MTLSSSSWSTTIDRPANHGTSSRGSLRFGANRRKPSERDAPRLLSVHTDFVYGSDTYWWASTTASFRGNCFFKPSGINLDASCPTRRWSFRSSGRRMTACGRKRTVKNPLLLKSNVRFTPESGRWAGRIVNGRSRPIPATGMVQSRTTEAARFGWSNFARNGCHAAVTYHYNRYIYK